MRGRSIQINISQLQLLQTYVDGFRNVRNVGHDLGRYEQLLPLDATLLDGKAQFLLGLIDLGTVEVIVSHFDRGFHRLDQVAIQAGILAGLEPGGAGAISELFLSARETGMLVVYLRQAWTRHR